MKKLSKHYLITNRRINQNSELNKIATLDNIALQNMLNAFVTVKQNNHSKEDLSAFSRCEEYRKKLLQDETTISYEVFSSDKTAKVKAICKAAASKKKWCQFLYYLVKGTERPSILEIGTNVGISGSYMLEAAKGRNGHFITMEGLPQLCEIAGQQFARIVPPDEFEVIQGIYEDTIPKIMERDIQFNLLFIDGNHQKEPTLAYFNALKSKIDLPAVFIFDDIYWSTGMEEAWRTLKKDPAVSFSVDLYEQGIVIIDKDEPLHNQHFNLHLSY